MGIRADFRDRKKPIWQVDVLGSWDKFRTVNPDGTTTILRQVPRKEAWRAAYYVRNAHYTNVVTAYVRRGK